ncbi:hypothetical protein [Saliphagus sp. LR7]|uniref:hypothetical protein n=1 Tax=Saliphagus sp. LR7 TaxID=2282654 RepID=UPI000DF7B06D|nr:hypothetical protein [Saliphagus sp. LR7]
MSGSQQTAECFFEYRQVGDSAWTETARQDVDSSSPFSDVVDSLETGTEYEYRAVAEAGGERATGDTLRFVASDDAGEPTDEPYISNPGAFSVTLNMGLGETTSDLVEVWFRYRQVGASEWIETDRYVMSESGPFPGGDITGLEDETQYEYQGLIRTFVQDHAVLTDAVTGLNFDGVTLHGELTELYGPADTTVGFVYGPSGSDLSDPEGNADVESVDAAVLGDPGTFSFDVTGLEDGTDYDALAFSKATILTGDPSTYEFTTDPAVAVEAVTATNISGSTATLRSDLTFLYYDQADVSVEYREASSSGSWTQSSTQTRSATGEYEIDISGLTEGTEYEWRARVDVPSEGRTETTDPLTFTADSGGQTGDINLANDVPQRAWDALDAKPDFLNSGDYSVVDASAYDGRSGDLAELIRTASQNGEVVDLGNGTYEMETAVSTSQPLGETIAAIGDDATIYYVGTDLEYLFNINGATDLALEGITFDITEDPGNGTTDVGLMQCVNISNGAWFEDVTLRGQRQRQQDLTGDGNYNAVGGLNTFMVQVDDGATGLVHRCEFPDGGTDMSVETGSDSSHAIGPNSNPDHQGLNVWKEVTVKKFFGNGFYLTSSTPNGENIVWDCVAEENGKGGIRVSWGDTVIGGRTQVVTDHPTTGDHPAGTPLVCDYGDGVDIIGLQIIAEGNSWGGNAIQMRTEIEEVNFDRCVLDIESGNSRPVRMNRSGSSSTPVPQITFEDVYFHDRSNNTGALVGVSPPSADTGATLHIPDTDTCRLLSENNDEIEAGSNGTVIVEDDTSYTDQTITASDLGLADPTADYDGVPTTYFDYSTA